MGGRAVLEVSEAARIAPQLLTELSDSERARALERFRLLRPCLEDGVPLARLARQHHLQLRTLQRWLHAYRRSGLVGLVRKSRRDRWLAIPHSVRRPRGMRAGR